MAHKATLSLHATSKVKQNPLPRSRISTGSQQITTNSQRPHCAALINTKRCRAVSKLLYVTIPGKAMHKLQHLAMTHMIMKSRSDRQRRRSTMRKAMLCAKRCGLSQTCVCE